MQNIFHFHDLSTKTSQIAQICHETDEPIFVTENGCKSLVIMSAETYQKKLLLIEDVKRIDQSLNQIDNGECVDFYKFMQDMKIKHKL